MNVTQITIDHVRVSVDKPFDKVTKAFEQQLGQFDHETYKSLGAGEDVEKVRKKIEAMAGPSGFMLFRTSDHGALLRLADQKKKGSSWFLVGEFRPSMSEFCGEIQRKCVLHRSRILSRCRHGKNQTPARHLPLPRLCPFLHLQYLVGNPLFAIQMTQHDIRASLYAPLRVLIYENEAGKTCVEYDKPSSLFGQFGNAKVTDVATMLDLKLEQLVAKAIQ